MYTNFTTDQKSMKHTNLSILIGRKNYLLEINDMDNLYLFSYIHTLCFPRCLHTTQDNTLDKQKFMAVYTRNWQLFIVY